MNEQDKLKDRVKNIADLANAIVEDAATNEKGCSFDMAVVMGKGPNPPIIVTINAFIVQESMIEALVAADIPRMLKQLKDLVKESSEPQAPDAGITKH